MNATKATASFLVFIIIVSILSACGSGAKVPNGRYVPADESTALIIQAIVIDGNNFTMVQPLAGSITVKYTCDSKTGAITLTEDGGMTGYTTYEYKDDSIWLVSAFGNVEFAKE